MSTISKLEYQSWFLHFTFLPRCNKDFEELRAPKGCTNFRSKMRQVRAFQLYLFVLRKGVGSVQTDFLPNCNGFRDKYTLCKCSNVVFLLLAREIRGLNFS